MLDLLKIALRNLFRYWRRTVLTVGLVTPVPARVEMDVEIGGLHHLVLGIEDNDIFHVELPAGQAICIGVKNACLSVL